MRPSISIPLIILAFVIYVISFCGFIFSPVNYFFWVFIVLLTLCIGLIRFEFIGLAIIGELILGGYGYLFSLNIFGFPISLRIGIFFIACITFCYHVIRKKKSPRIAHKKIFVPFIILIAILAIGVFQGFFRNDFTITFFDANAYISVFYIVFLIEAFPTLKSINKLLSLLLSFSAALAVITIMLLGIYATFHYDNSLKAAISVDATIHEELSGESSFSQGTIAQRTQPKVEQFELDPTVTTKTKPASYRWLRDTGVAQVSYISGKFFRVFFPSHIFLIPALFVGLSLLWKKGLEHKKKLLIVSLCLIILALYISYSRSLWLGTVVGMGVFAVFWFKQTLHRQRAVIGLGIIALLLLVFITSSEAGDIVVSRVNSIIHPSTEVAGTHRIELAKALYEQIKHRPLFGSGFGTLVSFPTVLPNGEVIQAAFYIYELSYLDIAVKLGIVGLILFILFYGYLLVGLYKKYVRASAPVSIAFFSGFTALLIANITTPVFTHPLGFGLLALICAFIFIEHERSSTNSNVE